MRRAPSLRLLPKYPATGGLAVLAAAVTLLWWTGRDVTPLVVGPQISHGEPWRLLTSVLPHADPIHLLFNLYWLWAFGTLIEDVWGSFRTLCVFLVLAVGSSAAEFALGVGGIGLSGVGYGLFGLLWVLTHTHRRFYLVIDRQTTLVFVVWFFLCLALTSSGTWNIGNVAHASGAVLGLLLGNAIAHRRLERRRLFAAGLAAALLLAGAGATVARPHINRSGAAAQEAAYFGFAAIENGDFERAAAVYERAVVMNAREADWWHNLGVARLHLRRLEDALSAFQRAAALAPHDPEYVCAVGFVCKELGRSREALDAYKKAAQLREGSVGDAERLMADGKVVNPRPPAIDGDFEDEEPGDDP